MRAPVFLPRRLLPHLRVLHRRPQIWSSASVARRYNSGSSSEGNGKSRDAARTESSTNRSSSSSFSPPPFWTVGKSLFASVTAAGLGYAYAASNQSSQSQSSKEPKYGSVPDLEKVERKLSEFCTFLGYMLTSSV